MSDLSQLYQEVILDHNKSPRNFRIIDPCQHQANGHNPLCGDQVKVFLVLDGDVISDASFQGNGCAISTASASLMTQLVKGQSVAKATALFQHFHQVVTGQSSDEQGLGKLSVLLGVKNYPTRVKCATLAWHTLQAAIQQQAATVITE